MFCTYLYAMLAYVSYPKIVFMDKLAGLAQVQFSFIVDISPAYLTVYVRVSLKADKISIYFIIL